MADVLYPHGDVTGDEVLRHSDDGDSGTITLPYGVPIHCKRYNHLHVSPVYAKPQHNPLPNYALC